MGRLFRAGYANITVTDQKSTSHRPDKVFGGNYAGLPEAQRTTGIANAIVHETVAHQFQATLGNAQDALWYSRELNVDIPRSVRERHGTVADSDAQVDPKTRSKVLDGPIPIHSEDKKALLDQVGPGTKVEPPDEN
jgi:hypothetical protein